MRLVPLFLFPLLVFAQNIQVEDFDLYGNASADEMCIQLTSDNFWNTGSAWFREPIDLAQDFDLNLRILLGCRDEDGADGIVFVFFPQQRALGRMGEGMGFYGLRPSLGIELDTYQNYHLDDPDYDHLALLANGNIHHYRGLTQPVRLAADRDNVEDCEDHILRIVWTAKAGRMDVHFDGNLRQTLNLDVVNEIFGGQSKLYWGMTSATGRKRNVHRVCFDRMAFNMLDRVRFDFMTQHRIFQKKMVELETGMFVDGTAELTETGERELAKATAFLREHPTMTLEWYVHTATTDRELVTRRAAVLEKWLSDANIDPELLSFHAYAGQYLDDRGELSDRVTLRHFVAIP